MRNYLPTEKREQKFKYKSIYSIQMRPEIDQHIFRFENGYGASVIKKGLEGLYELALIRWKGNNYDLIYDKRIASDIIDSLFKNEVNDLLDQIKELEVLENETN